MKAVGVQVGYCLECGTTAAAGSGRVLDEPLLLSGMIASAIAISGVVGASQNDPAGWNSFYHSCTADNVCPLGEGEELVTACGCLDDFPEAAVMMQTVRLAGSDLACTAGTP